LLKATIENKTHRFIDRAISQCRRLSASSSSKADTLNL